MLLILSSSIVSDGSTLDDSFAEERASFCVNLDTNLVVAFSIVVVVVFVRVVLRVKLAAFVGGIEVLGYV